MKISGKITLLMFSALLIFANIGNASNIDYEIRSVAKGKIKDEELSNILKKEDIEYIVQIKESKKEKVKNKVHEIISIKSWQKKNKNRVILEMNDPDVVSFVDYSMTPMISVKSNKRFLKKMLSHPDVVAIYENKIYKMHTLQSLPLINQPQVLAQGHTGVGTSIAVLDTGIDYTRNEFGNCTAPNQPVGQCKVVFAQDFAANDGNPLDDNGHGTNVAAIASAVAPGADILSLDISFPGGGLFIDTNAAMSAMNWVMANRDVYNIKAVNNSWGDSGSNPFVCASVWEPIITDLKNLGIASVFSSGNDGHVNGINSPSCTAGVISVGAVYDANVGPIGWNACFDAVTASDRVTCFSNSASPLTLLAPGALITAGGSTLGGTSMAAPHVAGAIAVMKAQDVAPNDSVDQTVARLVSTGTTITDHRNNLPKPRLDIAAAVNDAIVNPPGTNVPDECQAGGTPRHTGLIVDGEPICVTTNTDGQFGFFANQSDVGKSISLRTAHGSGEVTIYFKAGSNAGPSSFDASSNDPGTEDTLITTITQSGWQYVTVHGNNHSGVTVLFEYSTGTPPGTNVPDECQAGGTPRHTGLIVDGEPICVTTNTDGQFGFFANQSDVGKSISLRTAHGSGEVTIYFKAGSNAGPSSFDASSSDPGTEDTLITTITQSGWQYVTVHGNNHSGVTVLFEYQ